MRKTPHPIDKQVGMNLKAKRQAQGMTQSQIGYAMGLTSQQIQHYEQGRNRISSSRLYEFSKVLGINVESLFQGCSNHNITFNTNNNLKKIRLEIISTLSEIHDSKKLETILYIVNSLIRK